MIKPITPRPMSPPPQRVVMRAALEFFGIAPRERGPRLNDHIERIVADAETK